ncbi:18189_t:CDS:2 [Cetraspora pellucida]|uniref:18189_t:CDS:1 n=1 Tax=Cetraspora pellucida TaxID=1433469 RepID=A0ACA9KTU9_9GLOM|nr:18189_t:CDS:2 [Cetraspora pellucida]
MENDQVEIQIENDKGPPVIDKKNQIKEWIKESTLFTKSAAISQDESFLVIFESIDNYDDIIIRMYNINSDETNNKDISEAHSETLSLTFTEEQEEQSWLIESSSFSSLSIAVSNEYKENFRLLALSCITDDDMQAPDSEIKSMCGYTRVWIIGKDFKAKECSIEINNGGIIQFISVDDDFTLILLKGNGIYKYRLRYLSDDMKFHSEVLVLDYPERIINALKYNCSEYVSRYMTVPHSDIVRKYLLRCLSRHYLLVDTSGRDPNKNIEIFNLKTNQLVNVFKRYKFVLSILDREKPGAFTISNDEKLLAYVSGNDLKIYLLENGLELSSLSCEDGMFDVEFMKFVLNDEKLLIFKADRTVATWDIFNSVRESVEFIPLEKTTTSGLAKQMTRIVIGPRLEKSENLGNKYFTILNIRPFFDDDENQIAWDKLVLSDHLTRSGLDSDWKELTPSDSNITNARPNAYGIDENVSLLDLEESELKYYQGVEPWAIHPAEKIIDTYIKVRPSFPRHVIYLDKDKKIRLLIGNNTIQIWRGKKLEFIRIVNDNPDEPEEPHEKFKIIKIKYGVEKFDLLISKEEGKKDIQIKIELDDDIIYIVRSAIDALIYLDSQSKSVNLAVGGKRITYNDIVQQTRNIITRFITLYSNPWRLIDFRYKLMSKFIILKDFLLITRILFGQRNESTDGSEKCISQILSVISMNDNESNTENDIKTKLIKIKNIISGYSFSHKNTKEERPLHSWQVSLKEILPDDKEYYSTNAMDNIGWMKVVSEVIPVLYEKELDWYAQEFLYKPCFGNKPLDLSSFKFHEVKKSSENSLKVYIPITQLIPRDTNLVLKSISDDEIPYIRMVPLINFATNKETQDPMDETKKVIIRLFLPGKYSSIELKDYSPFIRLLMKMDADDAFYDNPSMEAVMNWMWFILLGYPSNESLNQAPDTYDVVNPNSNKTLYSMVGEVPDNPFSNVLTSIIAVYNWDSIPLDTWNFWPLAIINVLGGFLFVIILANVIISFMGNAFSNAEKDSRRGVLRLQKDLISDYAILEGSSLTTKTNNFDYLFKDKLHVRYICFLDEPLLTDAWKEKSIELGSRWLEAYGFFARKESSDAEVDIDEVDFIWTRSENA